RFAWAAARRRRSKGTKPRSAVSRNSGRTTSTASSASTTSRLPAGRLRARYTSLPGGGSEAETAGKNAKRAVDRELSSIAAVRPIRYLLAMTHDKILIVDFGSQVTQLIARRVREEGVYCEIVPFQKAAEAFAAMKPRGVILSGGPASVIEDVSPRAPQAIFEAGVPVLGICYGEQAMAAQLGGTVEGGPHRA